MTQTTTDYLFQITPVPDRSISTGNSSDSGNTFDDHLSQASSLASDDSHTTGSGETPSDLHSHNDWGSNSKSYEDRAPLAISSPTAHSNEQSASTTTSTSEQDEPAGTVNDKNAPTDAVDGDDHDTDKLDETSAMPVAGQGACDPKQNNLKVASSRTTTFSAGGIANPKQVAGDRADGQPINDSAASPGSTAQRAAQAAKLDAVEGATVETARESSVATDGTDSQQESDAELRQSKEKKTAAAARSKSNLDAEVKEGEAVHDKPQSAIKEVSEAREAVQTITEEAQANSKQSISAAENELSDAETSSDDDRRDWRNESRASTAGAMNKAIATLAIGTTITPDASGNARSKSDDNDQATKPVTAKGDATAAAFSRLSRTSAGANISSGGTGADEGPRIDSARFVGRVAKAFQTAQDRGGTLQLRLSPPELGSLRLELSVKDGVMSAALQTETANARRLLLDHLPALRDRLAEQNIRVDRFDVDVRREGADGQTDTRGSQQQFQHQPEQPAPRRQAAPQPQPRETAPQEIVRATLGVSDAGLNLIV